MKLGFDADKYIEVQSGEILRRVRNFGRLYLEVGGKLCYDKHAARVLPGYKESTKVEMLKKISCMDGSSDLAIVYCVNAKNLVSSQYVGLTGMNYKEKVSKDLKDIDSFMNGKDKCGTRIVIVVTRFGAEEGVEKFVSQFGLDVYYHKEIERYEADMDLTMKGYEENDYVDLDEDLIVVTGPGGGSGKMGFCMSQIYHEKRNLEKRKGVGFAKFESFPIWNLVKNHPVNLAYEAATADIGDYNMVDKYHLKAYGVEATNYNRDVENFGILLGIFRRVSGEKWPCGYRSPTDMGVNMMKSGIVDDDVCRKAAEEEILRRMEDYSREVEKGQLGSEVLDRMREIMGSARDIIDYRD